MSNRSAFIIPKGVVFNQDTQGLCIEFDQDIIIQSPIGMPIEKITSKNGDVRVDIPCHLSEISAPNGKVYIGKEISVNSCSAQSIEAQASFKAEKITLSGSLQSLAAIDCKHISAEGSVQINGNATFETININGSTRFGADVRFNKAEFGSDLIVQGNCTGEDISSKGNIRIHGKTRAYKLICDYAKISCDKDVFLKLLRGKNIVLRGKKIDITAIQAHHHVAISEGSINSDVLVAQKADIHPNTIGKIMIVDVDYPLGPHSIKGCLSLEDIAPLLPNPQKFIQQRGILVKTDSQPESEDSFADAIKPWPAETQKEEEGPVEESTLSEEPHSTSFEESSIEENLEKQEQEPTIEVAAEDTVPVQEDSQAETEDSQAEEPAHHEPNGSIVEDVVQPMSAIKTINPFQPTDFSESSSSNQSFVDELSHIVGQANQAHKNAGAKEQVATVEEESAAHQADDSDVLRVADLYGMQDPFADYAKEENDSNKALVVIPVAPPAEVSLEDSEDEMSDELSDEMMPMSNIPPISASLENLYSRLKTQSEAIASDYGEDIPSSLEMMADLIEAREFSQLREEIKLIWSQVLRFHQKRNTRIPGKVTYAFNEINKLLN